MVTHLSKQEGKTLSYPMILYLDHYRTRNVLLDLTDLILVQMPLLLFQKADYR